MNNSTKIRQKFIEFFKSKSHTELQSSPLVPNDDPSILFTNAGMVQFKKWFTGDLKPKHKNVVTVQKCLRAGGKHNDLENVGYTPRHHTFFEMLGNFSFGKYFKEEAIKLAWDLLTKEYSLDKNRLIITVFKDDSESLKIWKKLTGFDENKILRISSSDNFWSMGEEGPCGPCSEIFFDNGSKITGGLPGSKNQDGNRFVEIWNLVFMEFLKKNNKLTNLPGKFVDTGMGLERITAVLSDKINNYDTDLFNFIFEKISIETKTKFNENTLISYRIISDHIKSITFMMAEGVLPSNEGRGYVLRRIIRRALLHVNKLSPGLTILHKLVDNVIDKYEKKYYELKNANSFIKNNLENEEKKFIETLSIGLDILNDEVSKISGVIFPSETAFKLYDTYGFPVDMTESILSKKGIKLDMNKYWSILENHKSLQKTSWVKDKNKTEDHLKSLLHKEIELTNFCGYDEDSSESTLVGILNDGKIVESVNQNDKVILIFNKTPFYAESGGQVGDSGVVLDENNELVGKINDTKKIGEGIYLHFVENCLRKIYLKNKYFLQIDKLKREKIRNNHSATHLLHESLRQVVGEHVSQKGSLVNEKKLRFDYSSNEQLSIEQIKKIEFLINKTIRSNTKVKISKMPIRKAIKSGAIALFGEKYPDIVRVVGIENSNESNLLNSIELCGGSHVYYTGQIGSFKILNDSSVSSGIRRVEALTGEEANNYYEKKLEIFEKIKNKLRATDETILDKIENLKKKSLLSVNSKTSDDLEFSEKKIIKFNNTSIYFDNLSCAVKDLKNCADIIKKEFKSGIIVLSTCQDKKVSIVVSVTNDLLDHYDSNEIIKKIITFLGGKGGGGRKDLSQGGAPLSENFAKMKSKIYDIIKS